MLGPTIVSAVPAATTHRRLVLAIAIACYACVFGCFVLFEVPGLGLGHFFYIPVALLALAGGMRLGFFGGVLAAALYALAIIGVGLLAVPTLSGSAAYAFAELFRWRDGLDLQSSRP